VTTTEWNEIQSLFEAARQSDRAASESDVLGTATSERIRSEVRRLLAVEPGPDFLVPPRLEGAQPGCKLGEFTLLEEIGRGGMGVVYRALQPSLGRIVAVKVLPRDKGLSAAQSESFSREARVVAQFSHPNLVAVHTVGEADGVRFFAMEFVPGGSLADELRRLREGRPASTPGQLPEPKSSDYFRSVAEVMRQAAEGLAYAHAQGKVHQDVKPSNLLLDPAGRLKLVDFGLVRDAEHPGARAGVLAGTVPYMSPEQARRGPGPLDHRTDVYSLGVVLYELLTLRRPFEGRTDEVVLSEIQRAEPPAIRKLNPRVPRDLETLCQKAMAKAPRERYATAGELRDDLGRFLLHEAIWARPPKALARMRSLYRRRRRELVGVLLVVAGVGVGWRMRTLAAAEPARVSLAVPGFPEAQVFVQELAPLEPTLGPRRALGPAPLRAERFEPGLYRFTIEVAGVGQAELTRVLARAKSYDLRAQIRSAAERSSDELSSMIEIPAGDFVYGVEAGDWPVIYQRRTVYLPVFWIDRYEVSNGAYQAFIDATGHRRPPFWPPEDSLEWRSRRKTWDRLPVTGVTFLDATSYAEWAGKRLPTQWEWEKAARGLAGFELPWKADSARGRDPTAKDFAVVDKLYRESVLERFGNYLDSVEPVDSKPEGRSPFGLSHVLGNAAEWTESLGFELDDAGAHPDWNRRVMRGGSFNAQPGGWAIPGYSIGPNEAWTVPTIGFRCARSAAP
jgi:serine/threonine protein kinase/formylglycine-generating enzyme required for sulfatase activity